jgi:hypothetical protein
MGEAGFEAELQRIIDTTGNAVTNSAGAKQTEETLPINDEIQELRDQGYTDEQIQTIINS